MNVSNVCAEFPGALTDGVTQALDHPRKKKTLSSILKSVFYSFKMEHPVLGI